MVAGDEVNYTWPLPRRSFLILDVIDVLSGDTLDDFERISYLPRERNAGHLLGTQCTPVGQKQERKREGPTCAVSLRGGLFGGCREPSVSEESAHLVPSHLAHTPGMRPGSSRSF